MPDTDARFTPQDIFTKDNAVLQYYIKQYESIFAEHYAKHLSEQNAFYDKLIATLNRLSLYQTRKSLMRLGSEERCKAEASVNKIVARLNSIDSNLIKVKDGAAGLSQCSKVIRHLVKRRGRICHFFVSNILQICDNAEIEYTYCKTLLESKYNTEMKHNIVFTPQEILAITRHNENMLRRDQSRKVANNIRNTMRYIECVRDKCNNRKYELIDTVLDSSDHLTKRAYTLSWVFGIATFVSLVLSLISLFCKGMVFMGCSL